MDQEDTGSRCEEQKVLAGLNKKTGRKHMKIKIIVDSLKNDRTPRRAANGNTCPW
jgi:hypothetical protein